MSAAAGTKPVKKVATKKIAAKKVSAAIKPIQPNTGWTASLSLCFEAGAHRPIVRRRHTGPLTIQRPFYPEERVAHVYLLHPPGGVVGGDELNIQAIAEIGAAGLVTTPGATKFYRSSGLTSKVKQSLEVQGGSLEWFPQENIFFNGALADLSTTINITNGSALACWDIQCFGRPAGDEVFVTGSVCNQLNVLVDGLPLFMDRLIINDEFDVSQRTVLRGSAVAGTLLLNNMTKDTCDRARRTLNALPEFFVTLVDSLLVVRYVGNSAQQAKAGFTNVWSDLRYYLNQQKPCTPRIWAT